MWGHYWYCVPTDLNNYLLSTASRSQHTATSFHKMNWNVSETPFPLIHLMSIHFACRSLTQNLISSTKWGTSHQFLIRNEFCTSRHALVIPKFLELNYGWIHAIVGFYLSALTDLRSVKLGRLFISFFFLQQRKFTNSIIIVFCDPFLKNWEGI